MGTLVYDPFYREIPAWFGLSLERLLAEKDPQAWVAFELGRTDEAECLRTFFRDRRAFDHAAFKASVAAAYRWLPGVEPLLGELRRAGAELHAFSNYSPWWELIEAELGLSRYLSWSFVSCRTGRRKPDPAAYRDAAATLGVGLEACLLVDDREENCAAARALGMDAIRYEGTPALLTALRARGRLDRGEEGLVGSPP